MDKKHLQVAVVGGLGAMSSPMARHWLNQSVVKVLKVHDRGTLSPSRGKAREEWQRYGATLVAGLDDLVGEGCLDGIFVCAGKNGDDAQIISRLATLLEAKSSGAFICHLSTVSRKFTRAAFAFCAEKNVHYVNYPLTGGVHGAQGASMLILASGPKQLYDKLSPALSIIGQPKYFGTDISNGATVKLIGHLMVFNSLSGIASAIAVQAETLNAGIIGGEAQIEFFNFLNNGSGGSNQWTQNLSKALANCDYASGFLIKHALIDALYAIEMCIETGVSWLAAAPLINIALAFSYIMQKVDPNLATGSCVRELISGRCAGLDEFMSQHAPLGMDAKLALEKCFHSLSEPMKKSALLHVTIDHFKQFSA